MFRLPKLRLNDSNNDISKYWLLASEYRIRILQRNNL